MLTAQELIDFEKDIAERFNRSEIPYPIHLSGGNEQQLLEIFKDFKPGDYCFSQWRNHYHALLASIPQEEVRRQILAGRSMTICSSEHRFFSSAIVAGCIPIALGVAHEIKRRGGSEKVWCFIGDMTALSGMASECARYSRSQGLPLHIIVEDNGKSVCTETAQAWGVEFTGRSIAMQLVADRYYKFTLPWPHAGAGHRVQF